MKKKLIFIAVLSFLMYACSTSQSNNQASDNPQSAAPSASMSKVSAGGGNSLYIDFEGQLWSWGFGVLGDGIFEPRAKPVQVGTDSWMAVASGYLHRLGIKSDGSLWSWGNNWYGQLGNETIDEFALNPTQVGTDNDWASVSAGGYHSLAIKTDGSLWTWGYNNHYQLGNGVTTDQNLPQKVLSDKKWVKGLANYSMSVVLGEDGTIWAFGDNGYLENKFPEQVGLYSDFKDLAIGGKSILGIKVDGTLWEYDMHSSDVEEFIQVGVDSDWEMVTQGDEHVLAIKKDGSLWGWGRNEVGQIGSDEAQLYNETPVQVGLGQIWIAVSTSNESSLNSSHTIGVTQAGEVWAWGSNSYGQIGQHDPYLVVPTQIGIDSDWSDLVSGLYGTWGIKDDNTLYHWGLDVVSVINDVPVLADSDSWKMVESSGFQSVALKSDGSLWLLGGTFSDGSTAVFSILEPLQVGAANDWKDISVGDSFFIALKNDNTLWIWMNYDWMEDDTGDFDYVPKIPKALFSGNTWTATSASEYGVVMIKSDGTLWTIDNIYSNSSLSEVEAALKQVGAASNWASVSMKHRNYLALRNDNTLWEWGYIGYGFYDEDFFDFVKSPVQVGADSDWTFASAGVSHSTAIKSDGSLWSWGFNYYGQLGDGTTDPGSIVDDRQPTKNVTPFQVGNSYDWSKVSAGYSYSAGVKTDGALWGWGLNSYGQLGNGTAIQMTPVKVNF